MILGMFYGLWLLLAGLYVMMFDKPARHQWQAPPAAWAGTVGMVIAFAGIVACAVKIARSGNLGEP